MSDTTIDVSPETKVASRPKYEVPRLQLMTEREILNTFQLTQSMGTWWVTASMC